MLDAHLIAKTRPLANPENIILWNDYRITVLAERLFRVEKDEAHIFCDEATEAVWFRDMPPVAFQTEAAEGKLCVSTALATLVLCEDFEKSHVLLNGKKIPLDNSENMKGTYSTLDTCNGNYSQKINAEIELDMGVVSKNGVAVLDYTRSSVLTAEGMIRKVRRDSLDIYIFAYGKDYRAAIRAFYMIAGETPKLPRFALGNWWSRYYEYTEREYLNVIDRMAERDVPITVATVDMDWHWNSANLPEGKGVHANGWTGYSWNTKLFPDYKAFLRKLHARGCAVTLNLHPASGVRYFEDMYEEMAREMGIDPASRKTVEVDFASERFINAYFKVIHKPYEHDGVDFWWIDWQQGPRAKAAGIDIMWVLNHYHTLDNAKEHTPLILSRYSGLGAHRYPLGFSGDTYITWKSLAYLPYFTSTASNIGFSWWSHDIGGHMQGEKDDELYVRFVQFGVFSPINRLHCTSAPFQTKEPISYMKGTGLIAEEFLRLRHRMIPFLYSAMLDTNKNGKALIEPMYYEYPDEKDAYEAKDQYFFGGELLVAPVITKGDDKGLAKTRVWLPKGTWTDIFTGDRYTGGRWISVVRTVDSIPVFGKEGGFFVLDGAKHTNRIDTPTKLAVMAFNGNGEYVFREDNAKTYFTSKAEAGKQTVTIYTDGEMCEREIKLEMRNIKDGSVNVLASGKSYEAEISGDGFLVVKLPSVCAGTEYIVTVEYPKNAREYRDERYLYALTRLEAENYYKDRLWSFHELERDSDLIRAIMGEDSLSENEKIRLTEAL